jgi:NDP-sugar pyrophosphorylase family protein
MNLAIIESEYSSPITPESSSKYLLRVDGEYLIERAIRIAYKSGFQKVYCLINSRDLVVREFLQSKKFDLPVEIILQTARSTTNAISTLSEHFLNEPLCLLSADSIFDENEYLNFINCSFVHEDVDGIIGVATNNNKHRPLYVAMNEDDIILKFTDSSEGYNWSNGGIYYFTPKIFNELDFAVENGLTEIKKYLSLLVGKGYVLKGHSFSKIIHISDPTE